MSEFLSKIPMPLGGLALGLASLGILLQKVSFLYLLCGLIATICLILLVLRVISQPKAFISDFNNPILASVSGTICMSTMQLSTYLISFSYSIAYSIWLIALGAHCCVIAIVTQRFIINFSLNNIYPTFFITYVGIIVASVTSPLYDMQFLGRILWVFGFLSYLILLVVITLRYYRLPVPESAQPLFCIYAAPMSLSLVGYLSCFDSPSLFTASILLIAAQGFLLLVLIKLPSLLNIDFYPSYAAMTFPFVVSATALIKTVELASTVAPFTLLSTILCTCEVLLALIMVSYVTLCYGIWFTSILKECIHIPNQKEKLVQKNDKAFQKQTRLPTLNQQID